MWEIKGKNNVVKAMPSTKPEYNGIWMEQCYVTVNVESPTPIGFEIGDYIIYRDERFEINYDPGKIKCAPPYSKGDAFKYENIKFNSLADELTRCDFLDVVLNDNQLHFTGLPKFSFYGSVQDLANRMQANLDRTYGKNTWHVIVSPEYTDRKEINVSVDNIKVQGALSILVNDFEAYYTIKDRTITIGAAGVPAGHLFKYGKGNGLYEIEQNAEADQAIVTRLRAYGSTRNLPHRYYNSLTSADGQKLIPDNMAVQHLMLPSFPYTTQDPYIDSPNIDKLGIREDTVFFDGSQEGLEEIYPSIEGMTAEQLHDAGVTCNATGALDEIVGATQMADNGVGEIEGDNSEAEPPTFKVTLKDLGFDINDHLTTEAATLSFKTGKLGGREFEIVDCKKDGNNYILELNRIYDDSIKLWFPYKDYNAAAGDKIVILHIEMPEVYIKAAAVRLKEAAEKWLSKNDYSRSVYAPKIDEIFMARQHDEAMASSGTIKSLHDNIKEGMLLLFEDEDLNIDASIFIDRLTIKEEGEIPTYEVVLKEEKTIGRLDKMQNQIDSLAQGKGQGRGYTAAQIRSMIEAYGGTRFLSKLKDDRSVGKIASDIAVEVGDFVSGVSGGILRRRADGQTELEVDRLWVRVKALFEELTAVRTEAMAGEFLVSPAGGIECNGVTETKDASGNVTGWRCSFPSEIDGEKVRNTFKPGDQARCSFWNAANETSNKVSHKFYWRLVTAVGDGFIELSKDICADNSDIPEAGDHIVQLGKQGEGDDDRKTAIRISTVLGDVPSITLLRDIHTFSLEGCDAVSIGVDATTGRPYLRCYGDMHYGSRDKSGSYLAYDSATGDMEYKGRLNLLSPVGDGTLGDVVAEAGNAGLRLVLSEQAAGVACDAQGNPTGELPTVTATVYRDTAEDTGWDFAASGTGCGVGKLSRNAFRVTSLTADTASVKVTATRTGQPTLTARVSLYKVRPGADGKPATVYSVEASPGVVMRKPGGGFNVSSVQVTKYRTTGDAPRETTSDKYVFYSFEGAAGGGMLLGSGSHSIGVPASYIPDGATAVVLTLREGSSATSDALDALTVPVLTDAADLAIGGTNLLKGTNRGTAGWRANYSSGTGVEGKFTLSEGVAEGGVRGVTLTNSAASVDSPSWQIAMFPIDPSVMQPGKRYRMSFDAVSATAGTVLWVCPQQATGKGRLSVERPEVTLAQATRRYSVTLTGRAPYPTPDADAAYYMCFTVVPGSEKWTEITLSNLKLEEGDVATAWSPAPSDPSDYLTEAILAASREDASFVGGLLLASLLRMGYTGTDGGYNVTAGINGIASLPGLSRVIALWAGGDMVDAAANADPGANPATAAIFHNGEAYWCGNRIRFTRDHIEVGDNVILDKDGLRLVDEGGRTLLSVVNRSIGDDFPAVQSAFKIDREFSKALSFVEERSFPSPGGLQGLSVLRISGGFTDDFPLHRPGEATLPKGSNLSGRVSLSFEKRLDTSEGLITQDVSFSPVEVTLLLNGQDTPVARWTGAFRTSGYGTSHIHTASVSFSHTTESEGEYTLRIAVRGSDALGGDAGVAACTVKQTGRVTLGFEQQTVLGNDGLLSVWPGLDGKSAAMLVRGKNADGGAAQGGFLVGGYGLRITEAGFEKTLNGGEKWTPCYFPDKT